MCIETHLAAHEGLRCHRQDLLENTKLDRCEAGEAIECHDRIPQQLRLWKVRIQLVEDFLLRMIAVLLHVLLKMLIDQRDILELTPGILRLGALCSEVQHLRRNVVLIELRDLRLQTLEEARLVELTPVQAQLPPDFLRYGAEDHDLSGIVDDGHRLKTELLEDTIGQTVKAQHIDVQDAAARIRRMREDLLLHRQGILLRHDQEPVLTEILRGVLQEVL